MKYSIIVPLAALFAFTACNNKTDNHGSSDSGKTAEVIKTQTKKPSANIIRRHVNIPSGFNYITNIGSVDIEFSFGDYSIDIEGDSTTLEYVNTDFDSNLLTVNLLSDENQDINRFGNGTKVTMYITAPDLQCVSICGTGGFKTQGIWKGNNLQLGLLGKGKMQFDDIECTSLTLQTTDVGTVDFSSIKADNITLYTRSQATVNANIDTKNLMVINDGSPKLSITGKAGMYNVKKPNDVNLSLKLQK